MLALNNGFIIICASSNTAQLRPCWALLSQFSTWFPRRRRKESLMQLLPSSQCCETLFNQVQSQHNRRIKKREEIQAACVEFLFRIRFCAPTMCDAWRGRESTGFIKIYEPNLKTKLPLIPRPKASIRMHSPPGA